jgi:hypothetical protein
VLSGRHSTFAEVTLTTDCLNPVAKKSSRRAGLIECSPIGAGGAQEVTKSTDVFARSSTSVTTPDKQNQTSADGDHRPRFGSRQIGYWPRHGWIS